MNPQNIGLGLLLVIGGASIYPRDMPFFRPKPVKLSGKFAEKLKADLLLETKRDTILCDDLFGIVRRAGIVYLHGNYHYYNDPAYLNIHEALARIQSDSWNNLKNTNVPVEFLETPGYYLYNSFGLRVRKPRVYGNRTHIKDLILDFVENSFE